MGKLSKILGLSIFAILFFAGTSFAAYLDGYTNITIYDGYGSGTGWYGEQEDQEVESGAVTGQDWDLEGFFQSGSLLALVGGWDFVNGINYGRTNYGSGDIFFETNDSNSGYDFVLDMDFYSETYNVYDISGSYTYESTSGGPGPVTGLPWRYSSGGTLLSSGNSFTYYPGLSDSEMGGGVTGGVHNAVFVDLAFLDPETEFTSYFTVKCGNDIVDGSGTAPIPEPATMLLFGTGLIGLAGVGRKKLMGRLKG